MSKKGDVPIRTCIGCREKRKKEELIWFAKSVEGVVRVNEKKPHQGRGFYLCPELGCFNRAKKRNRGVGFLETMDFRYLSTKGFFKE